MKHDVKIYVYLNIIFKYPIIIIMSTMTSKLCVARYLLNLNICSIYTCLFYLQQGCRDAVAVSYVISIVMGLID